MNKALSDAIAAAVEKEMSFRASQLFVMLTSMGLMKPELVRALLPRISEQVMLVEGKRGFGHDAKLRKLWTELQRHMQRL